MKCKFCHIKESPNKSGLSRHEKHCKKNPNFVPNSGGRKGLNGDPRIRHSEETRQKLSNICKGVAATVDAEIERKRKISEKAKLNNGGYRQGSGRGKKGWYKGFFCDSSWELAFVIYSLDHGKNIVRNIEKRQYIFDGVIRNYIPDFIVDGKIVEIKGYKTDQWMAKIQSNPDVDVLYEKDLVDIIRYVVDKYGKDYIKLYGR